MPIFFAPLRAEGPRSRPNEARRDPWKGCGLPLASQLVFRPEERIEPAKGVDVGDLDPLADDPQVLLIAKALDGPFYRLHVQTDTAREIDGRHRQLDGACVVASHLEERAHDLRLSVAEHEDLDLVFGIPKPSHELGEDSFGERGVVPDDDAERRPIEGKGHPIRERDRGRGPNNAVEDRAFTEEVAGTKHRKAALHHADAFEEADPALLKQKGVGRRLSLTEEDVALSERATILVDELT